MSRARESAASRRRSPEPRLRRARRGFTIVELVVAVLILSVGVLGLAGASGVMMRQMTGGVGRARAANLAQSRFDSIASTVRTSSTNPCTAFGALNSVTRDSAVTRGVRERWSVTTGRYTLTVVDSVMLPPAPKQAMTWVAFRTVMPCMQ